MKRREDVGRIEILFNERMNLILQDGENELGVKFRIVDMSAL